MEKDRDKRAFTLIEMMAVILVVGVLAAIAIPIVRGRTEQAKWSEGAATAGTIRQAIRAYHAQDSIAAAAMIGSTVDTIQGALGFQSGDLTGRYFQADNFTIANVDANGNATITVAAPAGLTGSGLLNSAGWVYSP
ncbi:MAG: prepilin-type N-terminal cleavage/methylation domain-containing protein [Planctomycetota bacterium]|jgi:prepilin-type N-terminal cleavage/methylation domain-containing protein